MILECKLPTYWLHGWRFMEGSHPLVYSSSGGSVDILMETPPTGNAQTAQSL